ncbi:hypothetical protein GCM10010448_71200 [Streptomyces glomeratus]|uniref:Uncharacterized protein n=1 Tax=Streptomyces glomeratus TaxID=284452 RepID=A0ABP6M5N0_9ACTN
MDTTSGCLGRPPRTAAEAAFVLLRRLAHIRWEAGYALRIGRLDRLAPEKTPSSHRYTAAEVGTTVKRSFT